MPDITDEQRAQVYRELAGNDRVRIPWPRRLCTCPRRWEASTHAAVRPGGRPPHDPKTTHPWSP